MSRPGKSEFEAKVAALVAERERQDAEIRSRYASGASTMFTAPATKEAPLTQEALEQKVAALIAERERQDAEIRSKYSTGKK